MVPLGGAASHSTTNRNDVCPTTARVPASALSGPGSDKFVSGGAWKFLFVSVAGNELPVDEP